MTLSACSAFLDFSEGARGIFSRDESVGNPRFKIGNPYTVDGVRYRPRRDLDYDETGIASWYGKDFAGKITANGEIFRPGVVSAAHKTLPMPSAVEVTNLENGRSLKVRINDRGPFSRGRIIDLSQEAARLLGFEKKGTARVRVRVLADESARLEKLAQRGSFPDIYADEESYGSIRVRPAATPAVSLKTTDGQTAADSGGSDSGAASAIDLVQAQRQGRRAVTVEQKAPRNTTIWIQVGAYSRQENADKITRKLEAASIRNGRTLEFRNNRGQTFYRVRIGPIATVGQADALLERLKILGHADAQVRLE